MRNREQRDVDWRTEGRGQADGGLAQKMTPVDGQDGDGENYRGDGRTDEQGLTDGDGRTEMNGWQRLRQNGFTQDRVQ